MTPLSDRVALDTPKMRRMIDAQSENTIMQHERHIAAELGVRPEQVAAAVSLLDDGNTIPFIARYRKEATGTLDEEQLRHVAEQIERLRALDERRAAVLASVEEQGKLTAELRAQIDAAANMTALEDLYAPYRPKRRTRASIAREKGLGPLADLILAQSRTRQTAAQLAEAYVSEAAPTVEDALAGARDIVAETISDHAAVRGRLRQRAMQVGVLRAGRIEGAADERGVYALYYEFEMPLPRLRPHQVLAINRGEEEKVLRVSVEVPEAEWLLAARAAFRPDRAIAAGRTVTTGDGRRRQAAAAAGRGARRAPRPDRDGRTPRHRGFRPQSARPVDPAAAGRPDGPGPRPRLPHRLQGGRRRRHRQGAGYDHNLPAPQGPSAARLAGAHRPPQRNAHRYRQRHGLARDGATGGRTDARTGRPALRHRQRGWGQRL
jgi:hypothetical protein